LTNKELYQTITEKLPLFFQPWWLDMVCDGSWNVALVKDIQGNIEAVLPYQVEQKWGFKLLRNPILTPYLGPVFFPPKEIKEGLQRLDWEEETINTLLVQLPSYHYFQFHSLPGFNNFLPFLHKGFSNTNRITYQIDLHQTEAVLLEKMQKRRRRYIRNGDEELMIVSGEYYANQFFELHRKTFEKKKDKYLYSKPFLEQLMQAAAENKASKFWAITEKNGTLVGALWVVYDHSNMYQLLSAFSEENTHHAAISLLTWHAIVEAKKMGLQVFDFEGSINAGIEPFFRKFGGDRANFLAFEHNRSKLWQLKKTLLG
jgi:hypothetical protein